MFAINHQNIVGTGFHQVCDFAEHDIVFVDNGRTD